MQISRVVPHKLEERHFLHSSLAQEVDESAAPPFFKTIRDLVGRVGLPMPRLYIIHEIQPPVYATGCDPEYAVTATTDILQLRSKRELRGVMVHGPAHVKHRDNLFSAISATLAGAISFWSHFAMFFGGRDSEGHSNPFVDILVAILAPIAAILIQMAISRSREFAADRAGTKICGTPEAWATALAKIQRDVQSAPLAPVEAHPGTVQMRIANSLSGGGFHRLFSIHPATEARVACLPAMRHGFV